MAFSFTIYENAFANGSDYAPVQRVGWAVGESWGEYIDTLTDVAPRVFVKGRQPHILHATTRDGLKSAQDIDSYTALVLDCDGTDSLDSVREFLSQFQFAWAFQARQAGTVWKYHVTIPFQEPIQPASWAAVGPIIRFFEGVVGDLFDRAMASTTALTGIYTRRAATDPVPVTESQKGPGIPWEVLVKWAQVSPQIQAPPAPRDKSHFEDCFTSAMDTDGLLGEWLPLKGAWSVECPHRHHASSRTKTFLYRDGRFVCMAGSCRGRHWSHFVSMLSEPARRMVVAGAAEDRLPLPVTTQTVPEIQKRLIDTVRAIRPVTRTSSVILVTPGAGKSRSVTEFLNEYAAPIEGAFGRTAVFSTPTNALMRELSERVGIPYQTRVGPLAVLNDDGSFACKKWTLANDVQSRGGNVHRLVCASCEFREGCPAREGTTSGEGSLVLTNHALLPTVANKLHSANRTPLLVWDESPEWVSVDGLTLDDLDFLRGETQLRPKATSMSRAFDVEVFSEAHLVAVRPLIEIMTNPKLDSATFDVAASEWARLPYNRVVLSRAVSAVKGSAEGHPAEQIRSIVEGLGRLIPQAIPFTQMLAEDQERVLRATRVLDALIRATPPTAKFRRIAEGLIISDLSPNAKVFRANGGIVLDATASKTLLTAVRPDTHFTELHAKDGSDSERVWVFEATSRSRFEKPGEFTAAVERVHKSIRSRGKAVVFTYKSCVEEGRALWPGVDWHYFGNTRGYDRWFQEGFTVFITIGDPLQNIGVTKQVADYLGLDATQTQSLSKEQAAAELAQAHGRARDPQRGPPRHHYHYGSIPPFGWNQGNTQIVVGS